jgi:hypothetical protein
VTLVYTVTGAYDPATGGPSVTTVSQTGSGVERKFSAYRINGTSVLAGDTRFMLSPMKSDGTVITLPDSLPEGSTLTLADGTVKTVVAVEKTQPAGRLVYAELQLRGVKPS